MTAEAAAQQPIKLLHLLGSVLPGGDDISSYSWRTLPLTLLPSEIIGSSAGGLNLDEHLLPVLKSGKPYDDFEKYMETYVGLLREDCLSGMRNGLRHLRRGTLEARDMRVFRSVAVVAMSPPKMFGDSQGTILELSAASGRAEPPMFGSLLALAPGGSFSSSDIVWATVAGADLKKDGMRLYAELCPDLNEEGDAGLVSILLRSSGRIAIAESPTFYRAYAPAIRVLQSMDEETMPFVTEIVSVTVGPSPPQSAASGVEEPEEELIDASIVFDNIDSSSPIPTRQFITMLENASLEDVHERPATKFDPSQCSAVLAAMQSNVAIIQGPPGTGKTYGK